MEVCCAYRFWSSIFSPSKISNWYALRILAIMAWTFQAYLCVNAEESLLILRSLGIQTTTISPYYFLPATTRFIPTSQIRDVLIHEAFRGFEVRYYLAIVVEGEAEVVVVFPVSAKIYAHISSMGMDARQDSIQMTSPVLSLSTEYLLIKHMLTASLYFQELLPGRSIVEQAWRGARECLYEPKP